MFISIILQYVPVWVLWHISATRDPAVLADTWIKKTKHFDPSCTERPLLSVLWSGPQTGFNKILRSGVQIPSVPPHLQKKCLTRHPKNLNITFLSHYIYSLNISVIYSAHFISLHNGLNAALNNSPHCQVYNFGG